MNGKGEGNSGSVSEIEHVGKPLVIPALILKTYRIGFQHPETLGMPSNQRDQEVMGEPLRKREGHVEGSGKAFLLRKSSARDQG